MNKETEINKSIAIKIRKEVRIFMKSIPTILSKDVEKDSVRETVMCYFLWKMKTQPEIETSDDLAKAVLDKKENQYATLIQDELIFDIGKDKDKWLEFKSILKKYSIEELADSVLMIDDLNEIYLGRVPVGLGELVDKILGIKKNESILQIGTSSYILDSKKSNSKSLYEVYEEENYVATTLISCLSEVMGIGDIVCRNKIDEDVKYDKVMIPGVFGTVGKVYLTDIESDLEDMWPDFPRDASYEWNTCAEGILRTNDNGKVVAILNSGLLTLNKYRKVREYLCKEGLIEGVILLPDKMYENVWINPYLVIFSRNNKSIKFLDAKSEYVISRKNSKRINLLNEEKIDSIMSKYALEEYCKEVSNDEVENNGFVLTPNRYISDSNIDKNRVCIKDVVSEIKRGISISASEMDQLISEEVSDLPCVLPADIVSGVVASEKYYHGEIRKPGKNEAHRGDVLITKVGNPFNIAVADKNYLVVGNVYILKIDNSKCSSEYVKCFLSSEAGQTEIMKYSTGSGTPVISISELSNIGIPVFDKDKQEELNKKAMDIVSKLEESYRQIKDCRDEMNSLFE